MPSAEQQLTSSTAALGVAHTVWPSCHRNSRVLRNGWGCLNSHLCTQQKTASNTDENDHNNQYATSGYCMHIANRVSSLYEANFQFMHLLQKINNKVLLYLCATGSKLQWLLASEIHDVCAQLTTTLHHWLRRRGRSRCDLIHLAYAGYITVSLVGRMAIGSASSDCPDLVTQATCPKTIPDITTCSSCCSFLEVSLAFFIVQRKSRPKQQQNFAAACTWKNTRKNHWQLQSYLFMHTFSSRLCDSKINTEKKKVCVEGGGGGAGIERKYL